MVGLAKRAVLPFRIYALHTLSTTAVRSKLISMKTIFLIAVTASLVAGCAISTTLSKSPVPSTKPGQPVSSGERKDADHGSSGINVDPIALLALFVSGGAVLYARWSAQATQRANEIAIHNERLTIYKGLQLFHMTLVTRGVGFPEEAIWHFSDHANLSEFYYSQGEHDQLKAIVDAAVALKGTHDEWTRQREEGDSHASDTARAMNVDFRAVRDLCKAADEKLRARLRLDQSTPNRFI
jgi:hypothetical protein